MELQDKLMEQPGQKSDVLNSREENLQQLCAYMQELLG